MLFRSDHFFVAKCTEVHDLNAIKSLARIIVVTDEAFLLFEPNKGNYTKSKLVAWSYLQSMFKIKVTGKKSIIIHWLAKNDKKKLWEQTFELINPTDLMEAILERLRRLDDIELRKPSEGYIVSPGLKEEEVTPEAIKNLDIEKINESIAIYESSLTSNPSVSKFQALMVLYQKVIHKMIIGN